MTKPSTKSKARPNARRAAQLRRLRESAGGVRHRSLDPNRPKPPEDLAKSNLAFRAIEIKTPRAPAANENIPEGMEAGLLFDMVIATDNPIELEGYDYETDSYVDYDEVLEISETAINMQRGVTMPLCLDHDIYNVDKHVGRAFNFRIVPAAQSESGKNELWATGSIARTEGNKDLITKVETRHLVNISVGYRVPRGSFRDITGQAGTTSGKPTLLATRWEMFEVSLLAVAADAVSYIRAAFAAAKEGNERMSKGAQGGRGKAPQRRSKAPARQPAAPAAHEELRDDDGNLIDADGNLIDAEGNIIDEEGNLLDENGDIIEDGQGEGDDPELNIDEPTEGQRGAPRGRTRAAPADLRLRRVAADCGIPDEFVDRYVGTGVSAASMITKWANERSSAANRAIRSGAGEGGAFGGARPGAGGGVSPQARGTGITLQQRGLMVRGIATTLQGKTVTDKGEASFADIRTGNGLARRVMQMHGLRMPENYEGTPLGFLGEMETRAIAPHVITDFDLIASQIQENFIATDAAAVQFPGAAIARQRSQSNMLASAGWSAAKFDPLLPNPEGGEVQGGSLTAYASLMQLEEFARRYAASDQLLEADLGQFFADTSLAFTNASVEAKIERMISVLNSNPAMLDGLRFWSTKRLNVLQNTKLDVEGVAKAQAALAKGRLVGNATIIAVPTSGILEANRVAAATNPTRAEDVNPYGGRLTVVEIPGMPEGSWMLLKSPNQVPAFFDLGKTGNRAPTVRAFRTAQFVGAEYQVVDYFNFVHANPDGAVLVFKGAAPAVFEVTGQPTNFGFAA